MSITDSTGHTVPDPSTVEPDDDTAAHSIEATKSVARQIRDAIEETDQLDDVWATLNVNEPNLAESMIYFRVENDGLYYDVQVLPVTDESPDEDD